MRRGGWVKFAKGRSFARSGERPRVLVTDGDNVGVLAMIRGLDCAGYEPWVAAVYRNAPAVRSRAAAGVFIVPDPSVSADAFVGKIASLAKLIEPVAVLPGGEKGMLALADLAPGLPSASMFAVSDRETVFKATDKAALAGLGANAGLNTPQTFVINAEEAARKMPPVALPVVVKPLRSEFPSNDGFRKLGVRLARTREQVIAALRLLPENRGLLQRYERGSLSGVGGVFWGGKIVAAVHQRAVRTWPTDCGEMAFAVALPRDVELELGVTRLLAGLGWTGLFQMQFLETEEGRLLIDLNPRVYGSLALALAAGQNLPAVWIDLLLGRTTRAAPYRAGVSFRNELLDARALLASAHTNRWSALAANLARRATVHAFFETSDPMPLLALAPTLAGKISSRAKARWATNHKSQASSY